MWRLSKAYYSTTVTRWFTALTAQQRVFKLPFQAHTGAPSFSLSFK